MTAVLIALFVVGLAGIGLVLTTPIQSRWRHIGAGMCLATGLVALVAALTGV